MKGGASPTVAVVPFLGRRERSICRREDRAEESPQLKTHLHFSILGVCY